MNNSRSSVLLIALAVLVLAGCGAQPAANPPAGAGAPGTAPTPETQATPASQATPQVVAGAPVAAAPAEYVLETRIADSGFIFVGVSGPIAGVVNPDLLVAPGATVHLTLINGDGIRHDLTLPDFSAKTPVFGRSGQSAELSFVVAADQAGTYPYFCSVPGHRQSGQEGRLVVVAPAAR